MFRAVFLMVLSATLAATAPDQQTKQDPPGKDPIKIELNTAKVGTIEALPGIGPVLAVAIAEGRPYRSIEDLKKVKGMSDAKIAAIADHVTIAGVAQTADPESKTKGKPKSKSKTAKLGPGQKVNINKASLDELDVLPNVGAVKAKAIINARPFQSIEDLKKVKGIGPSTFEKLKDLVTLQ